MRCSWLILPSLLLVACGDSSSSGGGGGATSATGTGGAATTGSQTTSTGSGAGPCTKGAATTLPACGSSPASSVAVPTGCAPTIDGEYDAGEWSDAACVTVGSDPVYVKVSGDNLYLAWAMTPTCGCPAEIVFNTDGSATLDGKQIALDIFDDPAKNGGDSGEAASKTGSWNTAGAVSSGVKIGNPAANGNVTETYEISIPLSHLGISPGNAMTLGFGLSHNMSGTWPTTLDATSFVPADPSDWGKLTSASNWK